MNISSSNMTPDQVRRLHIALAIMKEIMIECKADAITTVADDRTTGGAIHLRVSHLGLTHNGNKNTSDD